jgi:hypothetical protein
VTVVNALAGLIRHPLHFLRTRWNWKAALLSAAVRGSLFFGTTIDLGLAVALRSLMVDATFRIPLAGTCAAVIQEVRWAEPRWAMIVVAVIGVPIAAHAIEISAHAIAGTPLLWHGVAASVSLSAVSSAAELVLMRHGVLLVGADRP